MTPVQAVEIARLVRRMHRHPGEARLLEIEDTGPCDLLGQRHLRTRRIAPAIPWTRRTRFIGVGLYRGVRALSERGTTSAGFFDRGSPRCRRTSPSRSPLAAGLSSADA